MFANGRCNGFRSLRLDNDGNNATFALSYCKDTAALAVLVTTQAAVDTVFFPITWLKVATKVSTINFNFTGVAPISPDTLTG